MTNLYLITELMYHNIRKKRGFEVERGFTDDHRNYSTEQMQICWLIPNRERADSNNERGRETQVEPWAKSQLPNNNKRHLCAIDQTVRGRWRARRGQIERNPLWSPPSFTKTVWGFTVDTEGRQMAQREDSTQKETATEQKEGKRQYGMSPKPQICKRPCILPLEEQETKLRDKMTTNNLAALLFLSPWQCFASLWLFCACL